MSRNASVDAPGQDSFLDIVANLVGILIILVMVIGVRAKNALLEAAPIVPAPDPQAELAAQADRLQQEAESLEADIHGIDATMKQQKVNLEFRRKEREKLQLLLRRVEEEIAERRSQLDDSQKRHFDLANELRAARAERERLLGDIESIRRAQSQVQVIEHLPTPMARTVFGQELNFRLLDGRLVYVPFDELLELFKADAQAHRHMLQEQPEFSETVGPIGGFSMRYTLHRDPESGLGPITLKVVEIVPVGDRLGEPLSGALSRGSRLMRRLENHPPDETTITVWTYPGSFDDFRQLKRELFERGYLVAARPLPAGERIRGSPQGTRSAAQ